MHLHQTLYYYRMGLVKTTFVPHWALRPPFVGEKSIASLYGPSNLEIWSKLNSCCPNENDHNSCFILVWDNHLNRITFHSNSLTKSFLLFEKSKMSHLDYCSRNKMIQFEWNEYVQLRRQKNVLHVENMNDNFFFWRSSPQLE